jgi:energy-coupling factor transporter transmembrane protein EcfT
VLFGSLVVVWVAARRFRLMAETTLRSIPYLAFLFVIQLVVIAVSAGELLTPLAFHRALVEVVRFIVMISSATLLFQTTEAAELMTAFRSLKGRRLPRAWNAAMELFGFIVGTSYQMVPIFYKEIGTMMRAQRARGAAVTEGSRLSQVRKLVRMGMPLFMRSLEIAKLTSIAVLNYGYDFRQPRSQLRRIRLSLADYVVTLCMATAAVSFLLWM